MNSFTKTILIAIITCIAVFLTYGLINAFLGNYFMSNIFNGILLTIGYIVLMVVFYKISRKIWLGVLLIGLCILQSCSYAKSNQQVLVSDDCGMNWKKINAGDAVPKGGINQCFMKVVIPNYPMQGEANFTTNLKDKVKATTHIDYDYSITNGLAFIKQAKFLGKANKDADDTDALDEKRFEMAENMVIDKRIRDVAKRLFLEEDIVELDQAELEAKLQLECNKVLEPLGIYLNFITLTFLPDEQTQQAIDVSTAMKIYQSKGLEDLGKQVIIERAGATKVSVENKLPEQQKTE